MDADGRLGAWIFAGCTGLIGLCYVGMGLWIRGYRFREPRWVRTWHGAYLAARCRRSKVCVVSISLFDDPCGAVSYCETHDTARLITDAADIARLQQLYCEQQQRRRNG